MSMSIQRMSCSAWSFVHTRSSATVHFEKGRSRVPTKNADLHIKREEFRPSRLILSDFFKSSHHQQYPELVLRVEKMVFSSVFSVGGSSGAGSSVGVWDEEEAVTSSAKDQLREGGRSSKFAFIRNLQFRANIRQKDVVWGGPAGSEEAPHGPTGMDAPLSPVRAKDANRVVFRYLVDENGPLSAPLSHVPSESDIDSSAAVFEDIIWEGSPGTINERRGAGSDKNQGPNSDNLVIPCEGFLSKHIQRQQRIGDNGKATRSRSRDRKQKFADKPSVQRFRGREKIDDETLTSRRSRETQSSRRSFATPRSFTGKISLSSRRSSNRRREDDAFSENRVASTTGSRSTAESENDRGVRSSSLGRHESSSRRPPESPRIRTEKPTDSPGLRGEKPSESPRKRTKASRKVSLDSPRKTPTSQKKKIVESTPPPESPRRTEKPTDSPRLRGEKPPESPRKRTETSRKVSLDSPRKTPTSQKKKIVESPRKTPESQRKIIPSSPTQMPYSRKNLASDSPRKSASDSPRKTLLTGKEYTKKPAPFSEKPESPRKISFSPRRSTSRLTLDDQSLLEDLTRKMLIDNMDEMRAPESFKAAKTNEVIKKHIQEVAAITGSKQKESTSSTARASPDGSSPPKEPLTLADQILLEDLTRKTLIDNMDETRGPESFKAAKTNEVIKKHIQEVAAMTGSNEKGTTSPTPASPGGSSSPKEPNIQPNRRTEESKSWGEVVRLVGCKQDLPAPQKE
jgi:hypothetical protein